MANYAFRFELMNAPEGDDGIGTDLPTRWLSLPTDVETSQAVANELGAERIEDCVYIGFESSIPQIEDDNFGDMHDFEQLNSLSQMLLEMTPADQVKFKAILSAEEPEKIDEILDIARNLHQYKFASQVEDSPQFFKNYMLRHMDTRFDPKWLDSLLLRREGDTLIQRIGASITDYGIISKRCGSLYELVPHDEPQENPLLKEEFDLIEVNDQTALFSNGRIRACDVPQGLYKYDMRSGETTDFATIESNVDVNHAATILVKKPFNFNGSDHIKLTEDNLPMKEQDKIKKPLHNVFGLKRSLNQSYESTKLVWDHYISAEMNLAEEQDDTYSIANCLAYKWQQNIDRGIELPDLYIVHIAIGAQGVTNKYMWYPEREQKLIPGKLGYVDISLHSFTKHILSLVNQYMKDTNKSAHYLMHWRGGEEDMCVPQTRLYNDLQDIYERIFQEYAEVLNADMYIALHRIICYKRAMDMDSSGNYLDSLKYINQVFEVLSEKHENISVFDPRKHPDYSHEKEHYGVFLEDDVHFTHNVNDWIASWIIKDIRQKLT